MKTILFKRLVSAAVLIFILTGTISLCGKNTGSIVQLIENRIAIQSMYSLDDVDDSVSVSMKQLAFLAGGFTLVLINIDVPSIIHASFLLPSRSRYTVKNRSTFS